MIADLLRRAAAKLREHAEKAWPGAWFSDEDTVYTVDGVRWVADCSAAANAANHIALMHPPVALALADWLDAEAHLYAPNVAAFALARAILREPS